METTLENPSLHPATHMEPVRQLLVMLDHPDEYTEQEILDIIHHDEDTCDTYRLMVEAKRSSRHRQDEKPADVDAAWQKFRQKLHPKQQGMGWMKIAAVFVGVLLMSGITFATIHLVHQYQKPATPTAEMMGNVATSATTATTPALACDTTAVHPIIYNNIPLGTMLPEIAAHYGAEVTFHSEEVRQLRFRFVWNPQQGIDQVVSDLNQFERLTVTRKENQITVK